MSKIDPVLTEIIRNRLVAATEEMAKTMIRTAFNPLLYEVQDFSVTLMSATGDMWAETAGVIVFSQGFPNAVRDGIRNWGGRIVEGDVLIVNDPFVTGTHISDTNVYMPVFVGDRLVAFCGVAAHWADIGGKNPGGWCRDTTDMYQEGICFKHQKLIDAGVRNHALFDLIAANVRVPVVVRGDLEAQIASCRQGARRVQELCGKYGADTVERSMAHVIEETDRSMRAMIAALPDGSHEASISLDSDGVSPEGPFRVNLTATIAGDRMGFSLRGSSPTAAGPINLPAPSSKGILASTMKGLLQPHDPCNAGHTRCIDFELPEDSLINPRYGAPTDSYGYLVVCLMELMFRCFARVLPERCPAGGYQLAGAFLSRNASPGLEPFVMVDATHGGNGALRNADGVTNQLVGNGDLPNSPVEVTETRQPVRINFLRFAPEVAGAGTFRGGMGVAKEYELLEPGISANFLIENTIDHTAIGFFGGEPGKTGHLRVIQDGQASAPMRTATGGIGPFPVGTRLQLTTSGGGGWGAPQSRDRTRVLEDVSNEFLTRDEALTLYGVDVAAKNTCWTTGAPA